MQPPEISNLIHIPSGFNVTKGTKLDYLFRAEPAMTLQCRSRFQPKSAAEIAKKALVSG